MKKNCRNCIHGKGQTKAFTQHALEVRGEMSAAVTKVRAEKDPSKKKRLAAIREVVMKPEHEELQKVHGGISVTQKPTDIDGVYIVCGNEDHLKDEKATKKGIVHKYYFACPHFQEEE